MTKRLNDRPNACRNIFMILIVLLVGVGLTACQTTAAYIPDTPCGKAALARKAAAATIVAIDRLCPLGNPLISEPEVTPVNP